MAKAKTEAKPVVKAKEVEPSISEAEYNRCTKLDVSDPNYINASLDHYKS